MKPEVLLSCSSKVDKFSKRSSAPLHKLSMVLIILLQPEYLPALGKATTRSYDNTA